MEFRFCPLCGDELVALRSGPDRGRRACGRGHFVHYANPALTAFAFVERAGRYLILERCQDPYRGHWELPGGFVEAGESPAQSVRREILEETGLRVARLDIVGAYTSRYGDDGKWTVDVAFHGYAQRGDVRLSPENSSLQWLGLSHIPRLAFAGERAALLEFRGTPRAAP